jgi:hypothetical protein
MQYHSNWTSKMPSNYGMTAEHRYISDALHKLWLEYSELEIQTTSFTPLPREDFDDIYHETLTKLIGLNPEAPLQELDDMAKSNANMAHKWQFSEKFHSKVMRLFVSIVFMSQALSEALVNQILILRFYDSGILDLYPIWDRARFIDKWCLAPKSLLPDYNFNKGGQIYQSLSKLVEMRNTYTHYKPEVTVDGVVIITGKPSKPVSYEDLMWRMRCFLSLPYDLMVMSSILMKDMNYRLLLDRGDIPVESGHAKELELLLQSHKI